MHRVILDQLEEHLSGATQSREFIAHLESCEECRAEVLEMQALSGALAAFRAPAEAAVPPAGFYAQVAGRVEAQRPRSLWNWLALDVRLERRIAFASLMTLAVLGSFLITRETDYSTGPTNPEVIMARQAPAENPDMMLATLASYEP